MYAFMRERDRGGKRGERERERREGERVVEGEMRERYEGRHRQGEGGRTNKTPPYFESTTGYRFTPVWDILLPLAWTPGRIVF